ncbi:RNI-like protein [Gonapodya prolifera JEL478]|uniref:RNI-like protein n=1 Tax=Gonapodya prolifera (strain JEL478) TaxID=1344416 RepID=A0A139AZ28_GONPJ|nr:RNI-like protein [Gonapodya prolifera JEL478]|eukprot:KXS21979.1 RNI-like protein [Gonapodya prolifera JEL478]
MLAVMEHSPDIAMSQYEFDEWCRIGLGLHHRDVDLASEWYRSAADKMHPDFQIYAATSVWVKWDHHEAIQWLQAAADQNYLPAKIFLAECYLQGLGVEESPNKAIMYLSDMAEGGDSNAQFNVGIALESQKDFDGAKRWYEKTLAQGHAGAMVNLGDLFYHGLLEEFPRDRKIAVAWYQQASDQGHPGACERLGYCYFNGVGVRSDSRLASRVPLYLRTVFERIWNGTAKVEVDLRGKFVPSDAAWGLMQTGRMTKLTLSENGLDVKRGIALADGLQKNPSLVKLVLQTNKIGDQGALALANVLQGRTNLRELNLQWNLIGAESGSVLSESISGLIHLQLLDLSGNQIGLRGFRALAKALQSLTRLKYLKLTYNSIGESGARALGKALCSLTGLRSFDLKKGYLESINFSMYMIGDDGTCALDVASKTLNNLKELSIGTNLIGDTGAHALAQAFQEKISLQTLSYDNNAGAFTLAEGLTHLSGLESLDLQGSEGALPLASALKTIKSLRKVYLAGNSIYNDAERQIREVLKNVEGKKVVALLVTSPHVTVAL